MKRVAYNFGLVLVLMGIFALPLSGFNFISYTEEQAPDVLGVTTTSFAQPRVVSKNLEIIEQLEYSVIVSEDNTENTLYDVVPSEYVNKNLLLSIPNEYKELGVSASLKKNASSVDLIINLSENAEDIEEIPATILILL